MKTVLKYLVTLLIGLSSVKSDFYSSIISMEKLWYTEKYYLTSLENYLRTNQDNLIYRSFFENVQFEHNRAKINRENYFKNPINVFLQIKRLIIDWKLILEVTPVVGDDIDYQEIEEIQYETIEDYDSVIEPVPFFPELSDLSGAVLGIGRLQRFYKIKSKDIANGILDGIHYGAELTANDCFRLGEEFYYNKEYDLALEWFKESIDIWNADDNEDDDSQLIKFNATETLHYMSMSAYNLDDIKLANLYTDILLDLEPENSIFQLNKDFLEKRLIRERNEKFKISQKQNITRNANNNSTFPTVYERICRNEIQPTARQLNPLRCRYVTNNVEFLRIAPLKLEEYNLDPYIAVYHEAIYDHEINEVIGAAKPYLQRSRIGGHNYNNVTYSEKRVSHNAWLENFKSDREINQRFSDMIGLNLQSAESLQIANYGIGGLFEPHWDFVDGHWGTNGNRIATTMFYLSDVEKGGATVFPILNVSIYPKKGTLLFWYNMHKSLKFDYRTLHAACPVLFGSKWVGNKWFHEFGQEFHRPCELKDDGDI